MNVDTVTVATAVSLLLALGFEWLKPRRSSSFRIRHLGWVNNVLLGWLNHLTIQLLAPYLSVLFLAGLALHPDGFFHLGDYPSMGSLPVTFLIMELVGYGSHRLFHAVPWLWRIHAVHHSDPTVDVSTSFRHHPVEIMVNNLLLIPVMLILQPDPADVLAWSLASVTLTTMSHGNFKLGRWDRFLSYFEPLAVTCRITNGLLTTYGLTPRETGECT